MTTEIISVGADATLKEAGDKMLKHHIHRLLVLDGNRVLGIVSTLDLIRAYQES